MAEKTVKITVNDQTLNAAPNETLLQAMLRYDIVVPHFCYHPKLSIAGVCRMCLVEVEGSRKLEISCSLPVREGMVVKTESGKVLEGRQSVMEFTLINHPLDCPICDQAGECWLQEYYMAHDRAPSQMDANDKVHKDKAKVLGPRVILDQERCILCTRCVRFCSEITETSEIGIFNRGDRSILDVAPGKTLQNAYSENVVDICPVGALTSRDFRFDGRVWFLQEAPSICPGCARGCNVVLQHREGTIRRLLPRINEEVNGHFMCDAGRDTYKEVHADNRLLSPSARGVAQPWARAFEQAVEKISTFRTKCDAKDVIALASVRSSNEENEVLIKFVQALFGPLALGWQDLTPKTWEEDKLLKKADRNPNTLGAQQVVEALAGKSSVIDTKKLPKLLEEGKVRGLIILNQDLLDTPDAKLRKSLESALSKLDLLMVFSTHRTPTTDLAHLAFPLTTFAEHNGSFVNFQGRQQEFKAAIEPVGESLPLWRILDGLAAKLDVSLKIDDTYRAKMTRSPEAHAS